MRERPILFSGPMVRAILDGRKTQTRRIIKPTPVEVVTFIGRDNRPTGEFGLCLEAERVQCPYGVPGDHLWARETWYCDDWTAGNFEQAHGNSRSGYVGQPPSDEAIIAGWKEHLYYRADGECCEQIPECDHDGSPNGAPWRPSIHMPRWASRLTLEVVAVRVERLCGISRTDAIAEGFAIEERASETDAFHNAWDTINGKRAPWVQNPWVWVIEFKRIP